MNDTKQGLIVCGTLANIKQVDSKTYGENTTPAHQKLQVTIFHDGDLSILDIKDTNSIYKKDSIGKVISLSVAYSVVNGNAYFRVI